MARILTKLRIDEVSAVDKSAGKGTKIVIMKRDDGEPMGKGRLERYQRLRDLAKRIVDDPHSIDDDIKARLKSATMKYVHTQYDVPERVLERLYHDEELGLAKAVEIVTGADGNSAHKSVDPIRAPVGDHHTVESGKFAARAAPFGTVKKEQPMESLESILKDFGPVKLCKHIADTGHSPVGELDLVMSLSQHVGGDVAFSRLYETEESVRKAIAIAKSAAFAGTALSDVVTFRTVTGEDFQPSVVTGGEWGDADDATQAWEQLCEIGRRMAPTATPEKQFALAFEDPKNLTLALRVYRRPQADGTSVYAMPSLPMPVARREKRDGAYGELMSKAEEYRSAHPELSVAQAFDKIYTDRANAELAKRERIESAPR